MSCGDETSRGIGEGRRGEKDGGDGGSGVTDRVGRVSPVARYRLRPRAKGGRYRVRRGSGLWVVGGRGEDWYCDDGGGSGGSGSGGERCALMGCLNERVGEANGYGDMSAVDEDVDEDVDEHVDEDVYTWDGDNGGLKVMGIGREVESERGNVNQESINCEMVPIPVVVSDDFGGVVRLVRMGVNEGGNGCGDGCGDGDGGVDVDVAGSSKRLEGFGGGGEFYIYGTEEYLGRSRASPVEVEVEVEDEDGAQGALRKDLSPPPPPPPPPPPQAMPTASPSPPPQPPPQATPQNITTLPKIRITCLSDTHNNTPQNLPPGDLLIHAGDLTNQGTYPELLKASTWLKSLTKLGYQYKIIVPGNHDLCLDREWVERWGDELGREGTQGLGREEDEAVGRGEWKGRLWRRCVGLFGEEDGLIYLGPGEEDGEKEGEGGEGSGRGEKKGMLRRLKFRGGGVVTVYGCAYLPTVLWERGGIMSGSAARSGGGGGGGGGVTSNNYHASTTQRPREWAFGYSSPPPTAKFHLDTKTRTPPSPPQFLGDEYLRQALSIVRPRLHVFGHVHEGRGVQKCRWEGSAGSRTFVKYREGGVVEFEFVEGGGSKKVDLVDLTGRGKGNANANGWGKLVGGEETVFVNAAYLVRSYRKGGGGAGKKRFNKPVVVDLEVDVDGDVGKGDGERKIGFSG